MGSFQKIVSKSLIIALVVVLILQVPIKSFASEVEIDEQDGEGAPQEETSEVIMPKQPDGWPEGPMVISESAVVMDYDTGTIVYDKCGEDAHFPASITKVMTALVALENCELDERIVFSQNAVYSIEPGSSSISRDVDEEMSLEECLYGLMLESANECGNAIAEHIGGDVATFVDMMNKKAKDLGCTNTHFVNPHGLHDPDHYTCAKDMAIIARAAYSNPSFALITGTKNYTIPPTNKHEEPTLLNNHHGMLNYYRTNKHIYDFCVGGKTGYTSDALGTLVTFAKKDGVTLIVVTMCGPSDSNYIDTRALFDYYFGCMQSIPIKDLGENINTMLNKRISSLLNNDEVPYEINEESTIFVPVGADLNSLEIDYIEDTNSDTNTLGSIQYVYCQRVVGIAGILGKEVDRYPFLNSSKLKKDEKQKYIGINLIKIFGYGVAIIAILAIVSYVFLKTNTAVDTVRRKRIENRDPHKNMRRIKRRRQKRRRR